MKKISRTVSGAAFGALMALGLVLAGPGYAAADPRFKCTETVTRIVCCLLDGTEPLDCTVIQKPF